MKKTVIYSEPIDIDGQFTPTTDRTTLLKELIKTGQFEKANQLLDAYKKKEDLLRKDRTPEFAMERYLQNLNPFSRMAPLGDTISNEKQTEEATPINLVRENIARQQQSENMRQEAIRAEVEAGLKFRQIMGSLGLEERKLQSFEEKEQMNNLKDSIDLIMANYDAKITAASDDPAMVKALNEEKIKILEATVRPFLNKSGYDLQKKRVLKNK